MAWHPPRHRVNTEIDLCAVFLQQLGQFLDHVLGLGDRHTVPGNDDDPPGVLEQFRRFLGAGGLDLSLLRGGPRGGE